MVGKIHAALDARADDDFMVVVRTDAHGVEGIDAAIERANCYAEGGADCLFLEGLHSLEDLRRIGAEVACTQKMTNLTYFRASDGQPASIPDRHEKPRLSYEDLYAMGFTIALVGSQPMRVACLAMYEYYERLKASGLGAVVAAGEAMVGTPLEDWYRLTGYDELTALEDRYLPADQLRGHSDPQPGYYAGQNP
jgi:2-methylisocitrate lyase-like PEP mutase family enzyme